MKNITIVNYGMGNIHSIAKQLDYLDVPYTVSNEPSVISNADKLLLPGVGHFSKAIENLKNLRLIQALNHAAISRQVPTLGICLGMQLMAQFSEEGNAKGLGWFSGHVSHFRIAPTDQLRFKVPHVGWNHAKYIKKSPLLNGLVDNAEFYFVHSFHYITQAKEEVLTKTDYSYTFVSAIVKNNLFGVQFHPEKSHDAGRQLLNNFVCI